MGLGILIIVVNVLVVTLVAVGMSERGISGWWATLRGDWASIDEAVDAQDPLALEDPGTATAAPDGSQTTADDSAATTGPAPAADPGSPEQLYAAGEDLTVLVLGDRTSVHENDWPYAWGRILAGERYVEVYSPTPGDPTEYGDPLRLGGGDARVSIFNASYLEGTPVYAAERLSLLAPVDPDVVLLSYGRANTPQDLPAQLDQLWTATGEQFPQAERHVVVAPPRLDGLPTTEEATRAWAGQVGAPTVDVAEVFVRDDLLWVTQSGRDLLAVNIYGNDIWARLVHEAVLGIPAPAGPSAAVSIPAAPFPTPPRVGA